MEGTNKKVPEVVIKRLPRYYRYLGDLLTQGITKISSTELSKKMNVTASQIRQDFNFFGGFGQQGYGYNVEYLYDEIAHILGLNVEKKMIIVGAGNIATAIANHPGFEKRGFKVVGIFDNSSDVIGKSINDIKVMDIKSLEEFTKNNHVDIGVLTVPKVAVQKTAMKLVDCGIKALLNFSYTELDLPDNISVEHVHLTDPLMTLSYKLNCNEK